MVRPEATAAVAAFKQKNHKGKGTAEEEAEVEAARLIMNQQMENQR